jgi:O-antigen/teichoic acid export membrane protein
MATTGKLLSDGIWVATLQGIAALGQLVGIKLLTEVMPPHIFGAVNLLLGAATLISTGVANPTIQALLRYYPEYHLNGQGFAARLMAYHQLSRLLFWLSPIIAIVSIITVWLGWVTAIQLVLIFALIVIDMLRMQNMALLNAVSYHRIYGVWMVAEAWGRPFLAVMLIKFFSASVTIVFIGFLLASIIAWITMRGSVPHDKPVSLHKLEENGLSKKFWQYTFPLFPLGVIGWISGMADRYMIGGLLSYQEVGMYAAVYGLASRPMLMLSTITLTAIRPSYYSAVIHKDKAASRRYLLTWFIIVFITGITFIALFALFNNEIAKLLLGPEFREASRLMPWIAMGYGVLGIYHIPAHVCLAHNESRAVTFAELSGAVLAIAFGFILIKSYGLDGAAIAVPLYFMAQLFVSVFLVTHAIKKDVK